MRLLALDTATETCGIALLVDGGIQAELNFFHGQTHAKHLMSGVEAVLELTGVPLNDIDGFAVTRGPGSFTGLRIGISTVKGLALAMGKPVVGISSLDVLARQADNSQEWICPMIDAGGVICGRIPSGRIPSNVLKRSWTVCRAARICVVQSNSI